MPRPLLERAALAVIGLAIPRDQREWTFGDTLEELARRETDAGRAAARRWLIAEAVWVSAHRLRRWPRESEPALLAALRRAVEETEGQR